MDDLAMRLLNKWSTMSALVLMLFVLSGCSSHSDGQYNRAYVDAALLADAGKLDLAYDRCMQVVDNAEGPERMSLAFQFCEKQTQQLKPIVVRFDTKKDTTTYPQDTYQTFIASVLKTLDEKNYPYLLKHMSSVTNTDLSDIEDILATSDSPRFKEHIEKLKNQLVQLSGTPGDIADNPYFDRVSENKGIETYTFYVNGSAFYLYQSNHLFYLGE